MPWWGATRQCACLRRSLLSYVGVLCSSRPGYDIEAIRFDHDSATWASWTHRQFIGQMVACSVVNSCFRGVLRFLSREARWASRMPGVDPWAQGGEVAPPSPGAAVPA